MTFCCKHALEAARLLAWKERDLGCGCDHNEYCGRCYPPEFRPGGYWDQQASALAAAPQQTAGRKLPPLPLTYWYHGREFYVKHQLEKYGAACRAAALEEAAKLFDRGGETVGKNIAAAIRALKEG